MRGEGISWTPLNRPAIQIVGLVAATSPPPCRFTAGDWDPPDRDRDRDAGLFLVLLPGLDPQDGGGGVRPALLATGGQIPSCSSRMTVPGVTVAALVLGRE